MSFRFFNANNAAFLGVSIAFGAIALALGLGWFGEWREPECDRLPVQSIASPSGALRAVHEQEACRSTNRLVTTVILKSDKSPDALVFRAETGDALGIMSVGQRSLSLSLKWVNESELTISHPAAVKPETRSSAPGLKVNFVAQSP
jgi:hypothetical protein